MKRLLLIFVLLEVLLIAVFVLSAHSALAATTDLVNPLAAIGVSSPGELITHALKGFVGIIGTVAIAFVVFSGFKLVIATNEESIKIAKQSITWSVGGFIVALLLFTIISGVGNFLGFAPSSATDKIVNPISGPSNPKDFASVLSFVMTNFLGILGFAAILMIVYYGYRYVTSAGNEEAIESAKTGLKWAITGFIVSILAYTIIAGIQALLTGPVP